MIKAFLGDNWLVIVVAVGALCLSWVQGAAHNEKGWVARWETRNADEATAKAAVELQHRERERELQNDLSKQLEISDSRRIEMQRIQSDARSALDGLQRTNAALQLRLQRSGDVTGNSGELPPATRAAMVLSDLYGSCSAQRQELASAFDEARARGLNVERMYNKARGQ